MNPTPFIILAAWLLSAALPIFVAHRSGSLYKWDLAILYAPAVGFVVALLLFNEPALTGWALVFGPIICLVLSVAVLHARVFVLPFIGLSTRGASRGSLLVAVLGAVAFGAFMSPWYE